MKDDFKNSLCTYLRSLSKEVIDFLFGVNTSFIGMDFEKELKEYGDEK